MKQTTPQFPTPWYRQPWPWLLMSMPLAALIGGAITLWLAISSNHALVVDDYYREGKAINLELARDHEARRLGLQATLTRQQDGTASLFLHGSDMTRLPPFVMLQLVHATQAGMDRQLALAAKAPGIYRGGEALPLTGRWNLVIADPDRRWRLVAATLGLATPIEFGASPATANKEAQ